MLRPERMSRVSVTGSKQVMDEVVETVHRMRLLHVTDYDGAWDGFDPGSPEEGADRASELLVTVRSLESILGVEAEEDSGPRRVLTREEIEEELEGVREEVNQLDDRRDDRRDELRELRERIAAVEPFADLGIDLDLLGGYEHLDVAVGEADPEAVRRSLLDADVSQYEIIHEGRTVAVFARTDDVESALVDADFASYEVPDGEGDPEEYVRQLESERRRVESKLDTVENQLEDLRHDVGEFLLAAEESLSIEVQRREAPLSFATTENAFVAEGWIPTERFVDLAEGLYDEVGDHVDVDELERARYDGEGALVDREEVGGGAPGVGDPTAADGGDEVRADGGHGHGHGSGRAGNPMSGGSPPVVQDNPGAVRPFESLVQVLNRPKYSELDPTVILFLTFPFFFGFMIGDLGYGLLYVGIGYWITQRFESDVVRSLGVIGIFSGVFTAIFGVLYGELFGLHQLGEILWAGHPPIHKGLQPYYVDYALAWIVLAMLAGILHLTIGWIFEFYETLEHSFTEAMLEVGSWLIMLFALWTWVFSTNAADLKPDFLVGSGSVFNGNPFAFGFTGLPELQVISLGGFGVPLHLPVFLVGLAMLVYAEPIDSAFGIEALNVVVNILSYARIPAVLLAKAGMALAVNLLVFGAYNHDGQIHLVFFSGAEEVAAAREAGEVIFGGLVTADGGVALVLGVLLGVVILVFGHLLVLALGVTSAGLQAVRLEYVEFMQKFYEGGGEPYDPFGYVREFTAED